MSHVQVSCGRSPNSLRWRLGQLGGHAFDDLLFDILTSELKRQDPNVRLQQTPRVEDRGRDIEIVTDTTLRLAGVSIHPPSVAPHTILVEVKTLTSGSRPRLPLSAFGKNYHQIRQLAYSHFLLVTNASISPRSAREVSESFSAAGKQFVLIDEYPLWVLLETHGVTGRWPTRPTLPPTDLVVETQVERTVQGEAIVLDIDLMLRNYSSVPRRVTVENHSELTWRQSIPEVTRTIEPGRFETLRLLAKTRRHEAGDLELRIHDHDGAEYPLRFDAHDIAFDFKPPLVGEQHHACLNDLATALAAEGPSRLISVVGAAGRGKTRLIEEALARTDRATRKVVRAVIDPGRSELAVDVVLDGLSGALGESSSRGDSDPDGPPGPVSAAAHRLLQRLTGLDHPLYSIVVLLEDLHHASDGLRAIVRDAPPYAVERLATLGENVPFFIVQAIEYMLETGIAVLLSRETVGIPNPAVFGSRIGFPAAMKAILSGRVLALAALPEGRRLRHFLEVSSFFGQIIPQELVHEAGRAASLAQEIASTPAFFRHFAGWRAGRLLSEAGRHRDAWPYFASIGALADAMTNFSSVNVDPACFDYLPPAFESAVACGESSSRLIRLLLLHSYIAVHHQSGRHGPDTAQRALSRLSRVFTGDAEALAARAKLTQLRAHGLMDIGDIGPATKLFLELEGTVKQPASTLRQPDLLFDLYNRLQDVYRMHNHLTVCERYGELADRAARLSGGELQAVSMFDSAIVYHYLDTPRCLRLQEEALAFARDFGAKRQIAQAEVGLIAASLSAARGDVERLKDLMTRTTDVLRHALDHSYGALLARIYLALATSAHLLAAHGVTPWSAVDKYVDLSLNAALTYRAGYDVWMIYNLKAVVALRAGRPIKEVNAYFATALRLLRRSALLFLGNLDLTYENIIVLSNIVRFVSEHGTEREKFGLALELRHYDDVDDGLARDAMADVAWMRARFAQLAHEVRTHRIIGQTAVPEAVLFDRQTGYAICVTC